LYKALSLYPTILICSILAGKLNFNNFGFNWAITIILFIVYFQILNRSYNNVTLSRLHKHNQQNMLIQHFFYTSKLHNMKKNQTQFIILNNHNQIPTLNTLVFYKIHYFSKFSTQL